MTADNRIWIGRDGQRYGPYSEDEISQWLLEGRVTAETLAWRDGMGDWAPLASFFVSGNASIPAAPLPPDMPPTTTALHATAMNVPGPFGDSTRASLP